jgi:hypothetical protein
VQPIEELECLAEGLVGLEGRPLAVLGGHHSRARTWCRHVRKAASSMLEVVSYAQVPLPTGPQTWLQYHACKQRLHRNRSFETLKQLEQQAPV